MTRKNKGIYKHGFALMLAIAILLTAVPMILASDGSFVYTSSKLGFSLKLPVAYESMIKIVETETQVEFYHIASADANYGGHLFSIRVFSPRSTWMTETGNYLPNFDVLYASKDSQYVAVYPTDVQFAPGETEVEYRAIFQTVCNRGYFIENLSIDNPLEIPSMNKSKSLAYIMGDTSGNVSPDKGITRAEASTMAFRLLKAGDKANDLESQFSDVAKGNWYYQAITYLATGGYLQGDGKGHFRPDDSMTRAEFATFLDRLMEVYSTVTWPEQPFTDVPDTHWAAIYIYNAAGNKWVVGYGDKTFKPERAVTRAEAVTMINRALERTNVYDEMTASRNPYKDLSSNHWAFGDLMGASGILPASTWVNADYATDALLAKYGSSINEYIEFAKAGYPKIIVAANTELKDFKYIEVGYKDENENFILYQKEVLHSLNELLPEKPFVVTWMDQGTIPHRGISFVDENNTTKYFALSMSGKDGSLLLIEF